LLVIHCHGAVGNYLGFQVAMGLYLEAHGGAGAPVLAALGVAAAVLRARTVGLDAGAPRAAPLHGRAAAVPALAVVREVFPGRREALEAAAAGEGPPAFALVNAPHVVELGEGGTRESCGLERLEPPWNQWAIPVCLCTEATEAGA